jgi:hypothetical protein
MDYPYNQSDREALRRGRREAQNPWLEIFAQRRREELTRRLEQEGTEIHGSMDSLLPWLQMELEQSFGVQLPMEGVWPALQELALEELEKLLGRLSEASA